MKEQILQKKGDLFLSNELVISDSPLFSKESEDSVLLEMLRSSKYKPNDEDNLFADYDNEKKKFKQQPASAVPETIQSPSLFT